MSPSGASEVMSSRAQLVLNSGGSVVLAAWRWPSALGLCCWRRSGVVSAWGLIQLLPGRPLSAGH